MLLKRVLFFWFFLFLLFHVSAQNAITVKGLISEKKHSKISVKHHLTNKQLAESEIAADGSFSMSFEISATDYYRLGFNDKQFLFLIPQPGENIVVNYDVNDPYSSIITGSKHSELIINTFKELKAYDVRAEEYKQKMMKEKDQYLKNTLKENSNSLATILFLQSNFLSLEKDVELYQTVVNDLEKTYPGNKFVADMKKQVKTQTAAGIGSEAPEIALPNPQGEIVKLSSLKGKVVLIDFWASWCRPCRMENPNVVKMYNKYKDQGFTIYAVSLDKTKESWVKAIQDDNLTWTHVSDLKYWNSSVVPQFGISGIPFTVLIDKEGKIVAKGLRGEQLEQKVHELLTKK